MLDNRFALKDTLKCSAIALALFVVVAFFPVAIVILCVVPAFMAVTTYRNSLKMGILGSMIVILGSAFLLGLGGMLLAVEFCSMGLLIGELMRRKVQSAYVIILSSALFIAIFIGYIYISGQGTMQEALDAMLNSYKMAVMQEGAAALDVIGGEDYLNEVIMLTRRVFPSFLMIFGILCSFVNYFFAGNMLMKMYLKRQAPMIAEFTLPGNVYMGTVLIMALTLMINSTQFAYSQSLIINLTVVLSLLFYLQGFACVYHFCMTRMKPGARNLLMIAIVIFVPFYTIVELIGFIDAGFNIRKLNR